MSIRVVLATDSQEPSGVGEHMLTLATELHREFDVVIACAASDRSRELLGRAARRGLAIKAFDACDGDRLAAWLAGSSADLLHVHAGIGWEGHGLAEAGTRAGITTVRTEHLPYLLTDESQRQQYRDGTQALDRIIAVSEASAETYRRNGIAAEKLSVVCNGIAPARAQCGRDAVRCHLGLRPDEALVLTVGRLTPQKAHQVLVEAVPAILSKLPGARFFLVGDGPEASNLQAAIAALGLCESVKLLGHRVDVPDLLGAADLFVLPSLFEGMPLVMLEAMAAGVPVVATRIGGVVEVLGDDYPLLVPAADRAALAQTIVDGLNDERLAQRVAAAGRDRFESRHRASRMADATAAIYRQALKTPPSPSRGSNTMAKTRLGFIGAGGIAQRHLGVLEQFGDVSLVAFADPDFERAQANAERFGAKVFDNYEALLEGVEVDALYICVPPFAHGPIEDAAIARSIPFFVEKPLAADLGVPERLARAIAERNLITAVGYHWRYLDVVDEAKRILAEKPAQLVEGFWLGDTPPPLWWRKLDQSGGQIVEQATHILDLARYLVGEVVSATSLVGHSDRPEYPDLDIPTASVASLRFASGAVGTISSTCLLGWTHRVGLHLFGDRIAIELSDRDIMVDVGAGRPYRQAEGDPVWREDRDFIDAVRGGENRIRSPYGEALKTHRLAVGIAQSAISGTPAFFPMDNASRTS
ncbi:MAG TPA: glycosyltransferase [Arsenicitalea sp.]|jgi:predicted dehydrogenase/glycosyltransferase involved in cell wall biosynthesis|nr:glycosyltransferase [Arsenicitalea sp.]